MARKNGGIHLFGRSAEAKRKEEAKARAKELCEMMRNQCILVQLASEAFGFPFEVAMIAYVPGQSSEHAITVGPKGAQERLTKAAEVLSE